MLCTLYFTLIISSFVSCHTHRSVALGLPECSNLESLPAFNIDNDNNDARVNFVLKQFAQKCRNIKEAVYEDDDQSNSQESALIILKSGNYFFEC